MWNGRDFLRLGKMTKKVVKKVLTNKVVNGILVMTRKVVKMKRIIVMTSKERCIWDLRIA